MKNVKWKNTILTLIVTGLTFGTYYLFLKSRYFIIFDYWFRHNKFKFVLFLFIFKIISVLWPPLTGGLFTMASIPLLGWLNAYMIDLIASTIGGIIAYFLGRKYGYRILGFLFDKKLVKKMCKVKVKSGREIEAVFLYRMFLGTTIIEAIYYGAGFLKIKFAYFLVGAVASHIVVGIPSYFLVKNVFEGKNLLLIILSIMFGIPFFVVFRRRYFE